MARLYEYQSKKILKDEGIPVPRGDVASSLQEARRIAEEIGGPVVLKVQLWVTGRAGWGGIQYAQTPEEAEKKAQDLLGKKIKNNVVEKLIVEEKLDLQSEMFAGLAIDDRSKLPCIIFSSVGGTGIEEISQKHPQKVVRYPVDVLKGFKDYEARNVARKAGMSGKMILSLSEVLVQLYSLARKYDARSAEINPLVITTDNSVYAVDCHLTIDDYAVFRHPELGIEVAREFDRPPTPLEKIAYQVEESDHRGTFYFLQMVEKVPPQGKYIGFNGAGGGGSMMSMDAVLNRGFELANYCDTSGNPASSKVYRAAKIILSQPNIKGYFASGSGVASQEQFHSARGLVKAFWEENLSVPGVIRLGGNYEEKAIEILNSYLKNVPARVEGYGRDDSSEFCAQRLEYLVRDNNQQSHKVRPLKEPGEEYLYSSFSFETITGKIFFDHQKCLNCRTKGCIEACCAQILKLESGKPVLNLSPGEVKKGKCTECLACELYCKFHEQDAIFIHLPVPGLKEYRERIGKED